MFRIGIAGCGIAGTAVSVHLARARHRVTLFERAPVLGPVGAGLLLQVSGQEALAELGLRGHLYQVVRGTRILIGILPMGGGRASFFWGTSRTGSTACAPVASRRGGTRSCPSAPPRPRSSPS